MSGLLLMCALWGGGSAWAGEAATPAEASASPTAAQAQAWIIWVDGELKRLGVEAARAAWAYATDITDAHAQDAERTDAAYSSFVTAQVQAAATYAKVPGLDPVTARMIHLLRVGSSAPAPADAEGAKALSGVKAAMEGHYGAASFLADGAERDLGWAENALTEATKARDYNGQLAAWKGWHDTAAVQRGRYQSFVEYSNRGARDIGFADTGELWRSGYDMTPAAFDAEVERLWTQVEPLYKKLHCHVRAELSEAYGGKKVSPKGPIPAHLLGNMWAQEWTNLYPLVEPFPGQTNLDLNAAMQAKGWDWKKMVQSAEGFFTSLGMDPLPTTFWDRSMFLKPDGKKAQCHASAWDVEMNDDLRIKMCIQVDFENLVTLHHELGHNYYYHAYTESPTLFQAGANDGFHEGIGDTLALSITPSYLQKIGLVDAVSETREARINKQMYDALSKIAFLPFGRMIDKWRWGVFSGEITPDRYNAAWWELRRKYQGIAPPVKRTEADFDPGAKYHIPANTPYMRYFLAHVLQFQFHEALCKAAGHTGPLDQCSIYGNKAAGAKLEAMLAMGASKPWPDALEAIAGTREMDAGAMKRYFAPLEAWLDTQNAGRTCGW
ncbi:MAG: hypothetical protein RLZZ383_1150 [Pseudomonadota bacterium]